MVKSNSSTGNRSKKMTTTQGNKSKKNSKTSTKSTVLGPMDFFVKRTETPPPLPPSSSSSSSSPPPPTTATSVEITATTTSESTTTLTNDISSATSTKRRKKIRTKSANVCGETELTDIISIIREWVETENELIDEDIAYILKFFYDLIEEKSFIFLASVIQEFYSSVNCRSDDQWKETFNNVILSIQSDLRSDPSLPQDLILPTFDI